MDEAIRRRTLLFVAAVYFASTWLAIPAPDDAAERIPQIARIGVMPPAALSGDSPHYLVAVHSLIDDRDFDVSNNYRRAERGGDDAGRRFRGRVLDHHADLHYTGREIPTHSPFFIALLAAVAFPVTGTAWVEPVCVWACMLAGLGALWWLAVRSDGIRWVWLVAFATPLWAYARDIWVEPFIALVWCLLVTVRRPWLLLALGLAGTLLKYPFAVVPAVLAILAYRRGEKGRAAALAASSVFGLVVAVATVQSLFRGVPHFSLFHSGIHGDFDWPFDGAIGLLFGPENGILFFCPLLAFAFAPLWRKRDWLLACVVFFLVHASYSDWMGGTGFGARYLIPLIPLCFAALAERPPRWSPLLKAAAAYSLFWGVLAGLAPALVYDRTPWGVVAHVVSKLAE